MERTGLKQDAMTNTNRSGYSLCQTAICMRFILSHGQEPTELWRRLVGPVSYETSMPRWNNIDPERTREAPTNNWARLPQISPPPARSTSMSLLCRLCKQVPPMPSPKISAEDAEAPRRPPTSPRRTSTVLSRRQY